MSERGFEAWLDRQARASAAGLAACLSRTDLVRHRDGFNQVIIPSPGSVLAAPATKARPGEPDYFFHWIRDGALVFNALPALAALGDASADWAQLFRDYVTFESGLARLDGSAVAAAARYRQGVVDEFVQFLRPEAELAAIRGEAVGGDVRVNADGTLDTIRWSRPQHDGPALRALALRRCLDAGFTAPAAEDRIALDIAYTLAHAGWPCCDLWEEGTAEHFHTLLVQAAALRLGDGVAQAAATRLLARLDAFWSPEDAVLRCALPAEPRKSLDMAVVLAVLQADLPGGPFSLDDPRVAATLTRLEAHFAAAYPINQGRADGIVCGRYPGDRYVTGGPWYITSFAAAEFRYRRAARGGQDRRRLIAEGDAILAAIRRTVPPSSALSEQFDPADGRQASARDLAWSHAAFVTALRARRVAGGTDP